MITNIPVNKELDIYVEHLYDDEWDYDVEISRELGDDTLLHDDVFSDDESRGSDSVGEQDYENEVDVDGPAIQTNNLRDTTTSSKPKGGLGEQTEDFVEVECNLSEQILRSLCDSDSEGAAHGPLNVFEGRNLKNEGFKFEIGMVFSYSKEFKWAVQYHEAMRQKDVMFKNNEHRRVRVPQPASQGVPEPDSHVPENNDLQDQFQDVVVETQVPEFVLNEIESMSSQPSQPKTNDIPTVADFISSTIANEPTPARKKFITVGGIKYTCTTTWFRRKGQ
nr:Zinc knuckle family protein [Ipomoea batatas]